jgi:hypothetical protein
MPKRRRMARPRCWVRLPTERLPLVAVTAMLALAHATPAAADGKAAYILAAPNDATWLALVTREGRWAVQFDTSVCRPLSPFTPVLLDSTTPTSAVWSGTTRCPLTRAVFVDPTPCATRDGQCAVDLEPRG